MRQAGAAIDYARRVLCPFVLGLAVTGCGAPAPAPFPTPAAMTLEDVVRRHVEARGGQAAIESIHSLEIDLRIVEPTYTATGLYRVDRKGRMRIDIFIEARRVFSESFDGSNGWQLLDGAEHPVPAEKGAAALRNSSQMPTNILGLHEMQAHGHRLASAGREQVDATLYHVVVLTLDGGQETRYYLDPQRFLITRARTLKPLHPDIDPTPTTIETVWSDFRPVAGVSFAYQATETDLATGKLLQTTTLLQVRPNLPAEDALFRLVPQAAAGRGRFRRSGTRAAAVCSRHGRPTQRRLVHRDSTTALRPHRAAPDRRHRRRHRDPRPAA